MNHEDEIRSIIRHALGVSGGRGAKSYRRHYCHDATPAILEAVEAGLLFGPRPAPWPGAVGASDTWYVTEAGATFVGEELPA